MDMLARSGTKLPIGVTEVELTLRAHFTVAVNLQGVALGQAMMESRRLRSSDSSEADNPMRL